MKKRYFIILMVLFTLIGCYFFMFSTPSNNELYSKYYSKIEKKKEYDNLEDNKDINISIDKGNINGKYHYVITFTSNSKLNNFKAMVISDNKELEYYPSFGIFDNQGINLVNSSPLEKETKGVNLVVSMTNSVDSLKAFVSYNDKEFYYLINM